MLRLSAAVEAVDARGQIRKAWRQAGAVEAFSLVYFKRVILALL
jgi:hypothetical protein